MPMNFETSVSPHIRARDDVQSIMWWVVFSLLPPIVAATWFFGLRALLRRETDHDP
jgi:Na+-translocating ferredoxin:NAD+ oxidoreductase RnfD subunit